MFKWAFNSAIPLCSTHSMIMVWEQDICRFTLLWGGARKHVVNSPSP
jgi:hypothetical protein